MKRCWKSDTKEANQPAVGASGKEEQSKGYSLNIIQ